MTALAIATLAVAPSACDVDRAGLDEAPVKLDASAGDTPIFHHDGVGGSDAGGASGGGVGGAGLGTGGAPGTGGDLGNGTGGGFVAGTGGEFVSGTGGNFIGGTGGVIVGGTGGGFAAGTGGFIAGTGGFVIMGTGGFVAGTGGFVMGTGGFVAGTGGAAMGTGGLIAGTGGFVGGTGGFVGGTGGKTAPGCNANTCAGGCCAGMVCVMSPSAQQCGHGGGACQPCAPCERCSTAGACELDPASQWELTAVSAVLSKNDPNYQGGAVGVWDQKSEQYGGSLPDPFVQFEMPAGTFVYSTDTITDSVTPTWNQTLNAPGTTLTASDLLPNGQPWEIWIGDDDANGFAELMCEINAPLDAASFKAGGFTRTNVTGSVPTAPTCTSVTFTLTCQP